MPHSPKSLPQHLSGCVWEEQNARARFGPLRSPHTFQHFHEYPESGRGCTQPVALQDSGHTQFISSPGWGLAAEPDLDGSHSRQLAFKLAVDITLAFLVEEGEDQSPRFHQWLHYHLANSSSATYDICKETKKPRRFIKVWEALSREAGTACRQHEVLENYGTSETYNPHRSHSFFHPNRLPAGLTPEQPSPNGRGAGREAESELPECAALPRFLSLPLSLSGCSWPLQHPESCVPGLLQSPWSYPRIMRNIEPHLFLRQYFPWALDFTWLILDRSKS